MSVGRDFRHVGAHGPGTARMTWKRAESMWPGCHIEWLRVIADRWTPYLRERHGVLVCNDAQCDNRTACMGSHACRCMTWDANIKRWRPRVHPLYVRIAEIEHCHVGRRHVALNDDLPCPECGGPTWRIKWTLHMACKDRLCDMSRGFEAPDPLL